jgi:hypothetical protein
MTWSDVDRVGENGHESTFVGPDFQARLLFDCHGDRRKLEVSHERGLPDGLLEHLKPFGPLQRPRSAAPPSAGGRRLDLKVPHVLRVTA